MDLRNYEPFQLLQRNSSSTNLFVSHHIQIGTCVLGAPLTIPTKEHLNHSIHFPGALKSKFTSTLSFQSPGDAPAIPTYRLMDSDGVVIDTTNDPKVGKELALKMYRDMVAGKKLVCERTEFFNVEN